MKPVLLITDVNFWERSSGNRERIYSLIKYLSQKVRLTVVNTGPAPIDIEKKLSGIFDAEFHILENNKYLSSNGYGRKLRSWLKGRLFDAVIIEYIHSSYFLNFLDFDALVILDAHDIISQRATEFKKFNYGGALYELSAEDEKEIFSVYDHVMVLCVADYEKVNKLTGNQSALLCPHAIEPVYLPVNDTVTNIVFVASAYLPNRDAINWFIENCWPRIVKKHKVQLKIYGTICSELGSINLEGISLNGYVANLSTIYKEADIIINPVRFGAGLKIKNMEALAHGLPLVTTAHGARGIEAGIKGAFLMANTPDEFIGAVSSLIESFPLRKKLHKNAIDFIEANFSADQCFGPLMIAISQNC